MQGCQFKFLNQSLMNLHQTYFGLVAMIIMARTLHLAGSALFAFPSLRNRHDSKVGLVPFYKLWDIIARCLLHSIGMIWDY